jgi:hypothetical protein
LLVTHVLIRRNEDVKLRFRATKQLTVFDAAPTALLNRYAIVANENFVNRPRDAFMQQNPHWAAGERSANSERSKTRRAIS